MRVIFRPEQPSPSSVTRQSNSSISELNRSRAKTISTTSTTPEGEGPSVQSTGFNLLQSIKDLTHQELNRANPLGLLGKEVILATGTTHCPEPIPPKEIDEILLTNIKTSPSSSSSMSPIDDNEPQQLHFPLNEEEKIRMQRRRSTLANTTDIPLPPCPAEFISTNNDQDLQPHLFSQPSPGTMVADFIPDTMTINVFEVFIYAWGVFAFFFDMVTDIVLAHAYYLEGAYWLFILTLMCVILPNLTLSVFSLVWYIDSSQLKAAANDQSKTEYETSHQTSYCQTDDLMEKDNVEDQVDAHISRIRHQPQIPEEKPKKKTFHLSSTTADVFTWIIRIVILVLQLDLCLKYIRGLYYTWKGFQKRHSPKWKRFYLTKQILIDADIALLRVFDCFMDSGSQVVLQLYIMLRLGSMSMKFDTLFAKQCLSIISSLGSLAYALSGYSRCWRHMQLTHSPHGWPKGKPPPQLVSWWSTIIQWFWYLFLITPRVLALAMFAATFRSWFWIILVAHWFGMLFWILRFRTIFCISDQTKYNPREAIFEKCYNLVCSYIFIFCYMNLRKGDTRLHYIGFYTIYYIENISFSIIYAIHSAETNSILKYSLVTFVCIGFWFAVLFQFIYYRFLHPSDHVRINTKHNVASIARIRPLPRFNRMKKSKSCEEMIDHNDLQNQNENNDLSETISLQFNSNSINERWHNRFSKENRQKLISQQQAIDQKVKLTRAQKQLEESTKRQQHPSRGILTKLSTNFKRPTTISASASTENKDNSNIANTTSITTTDNHSSNADNRSFRRQPFFNVTRVSLTRSPHQESYAKMQQEDEEDCDKPSISYISDKRAPQHQQQLKMYNIDEDVHISDDNYNNSSHISSSNNDDEKEMILTAAKLTPLIISSPTADNKSYISSTPITHISRC
ncbi:unnamed protein product [Rotaria sp. Silwood2]|nr:unnamed protein product [Rotaria sp. Silwood2]CAF2803732.1 unnamed protein product [Rotaria sp. Silwood2]CAF3196793.1 unnamed protein product [Rotaria sp. Silwood2]CAF4023056.1 unnamed protein product [Rotaria sp. Silwood2]CAF4060107.1 unnamed protein product [Rotaria sp. Silwood2]